MAFNLKALKKKATKSSKAKKASKVFGEKKTSKRAEQPTNMSIFSKGYKAVDDNAKRLELQKEEMKNRLWEFFLNPNEKAVIRFLTGEPITFYRHSFKTTRNGKEFYEKYTCLGEDCPMCAMGNKPSFMGAYLIIDRRPYTIKKGDNAGKKIKASIKLYVQGQTMLARLKLRHEDDGLTSRDYKFTRIGKDKSTTYEIDKQDKVKLSKQDKELIEKACTVIVDGKQRKLSLDELIIDNVKPLSHERIEEIFGGGDEPAKLSKKIRTF